MKNVPTDEEMAADQPGVTVRRYLRTAVEMIDEQFGKGFAARYPTLVAFVVNAHVALENPVRAETPAKKKPPGA